MLLLVTMAFTYHEFYVSVTETEYKTTTQTIQISIKFIGHDLEDVLEKAGVPELNLGTEKESESTNEYLLKYISSKFHIKINDTIIPLKFVGKEINNDDFFYCYLETEKIPSINSIEIHNELLTELYPKQENIFYLNIKGKTHSISFNKEKTTEKITF